MNFVEERLVEEIQSWTYETNIQMLNRRYTEARRRHNMYCHSNDDLRTEMDRKYKEQRERIKY